MTRSVEPGQQPPPLRIGHVDEAPPPVCVLALGAAVPHGVEEVVAGALGEHLEIRISFFKGENYKKLFKMPCATCNVSQPGFSPTKLMHILKNLRKSSEKLTWTFLSLLNLRLRSKPFLRDATISGKID